MKNMEKEICTMKFQLWNRIFYNLQFTNDQMMIVKTKKDLDI